jgi:hypothetical protein
MKTEEQLLKLFKDVNLDSYTVISESSLTNSIQLANLEELIKFSKSHNINTVFYHYSYVDKEAFLITDKITKECRLDEDDLYILQDKFNEYNENLFGIAIDNPICLTIYCIYQGVIFVAKESDNWFFEQGFDTPENVCDQLYEKFYDDIVEAEEDRMQLFEDDRDKLFQQLLDDENFHKCTNIQSRRIFINELEEDDEIKKIFSTKAGGYRRLWLKDFIEDTWREYKSSLKKK